MAEDMTPEQLVAKLNAVAAAAHRGAVTGLQQACLARQATAMRYCTPGQSPFDPMIFPTKKGGTGAPLDTGVLRANIYAYTEDKGDEIQARRFYAESKRISNARAKAELGWRPLYPTYREGLAAVLAAEQASVSP